MLPTNNFTKIICQIDLILKEKGEISYFYIKWHGHRRCRRSPGHLVLSWGYGGFGMKTDWKSFTLSPPIVTTTMCMCCLLRYCLKAVNNINTLTVYKMIQLPALQLCQNCFSGIYYSLITNLAKVKFHSTWLLIEHKKIDKQKMSCLAF